jgi:O-antigen/teichoic acid export membrane protein
MRIDRGYMLVVAGMSLRAAIQALVVILLARTLGTVDYGASVAVISVTGFFATLAGLGAAVLHLKDIAVEPANWRGSLWHHHKNIWRTQPILFVISSFVAWFVIRQHVDWCTLLAMVGGDILGLPHAEFAVRSHQGRGQYVGMAIMMCALPMLRLCALLCYFVVEGGVSLRAWGAIGLLSGAAVFSIVAAGVARSGRRRGERQRSSGSMVEGLGFAMTSASLRIHADADKAIIARLSSISAAGEYSLAYRLMDVLLLPVNGFIEWSIRLLFQYGREGIRESLKKTWMRWLTLFLVASLMSVMAYMLAPYLPLVFGEQYRNTVTMARWLCVLPLTATSWTIVRSIAATAGYEKLAGLIELVGAGLSVMLGVALVMAQGWRGAVLATYVVHLSMVFLLLSVVYGRGVHKRRAKA